jgi:hypothetical protein
MQNPFRYSEGDKAMALVIVFPPGVHGLFNPHVHNLVREVQENLDGVYVTYALSSGTSPDLRAAMDAARFVGCESVVVVPAGSGAVGEAVNRESGGDWLVTSSLPGVEFEASAVIGAYLTAVTEAGKAA